MLVHNMRGHTILKDAKSGKCLDVNSVHLEVYGLISQRSDWLYRVGCK